MWKTWGRIMWRFLKRIIDFITDSGEDESEIAVQKTATSVKKAHSQLKAAAVESSRKGVELSVSVLATGGGAGRSTGSEKEQTKVSVVHEGPKKKPTTIPHERQSFLARVGDGVADSSSLPPPVKIVSAHEITLKGIPFEATRNELVTIYLRSLSKCITANNLSSIPAQQRATHYIFLKSLANSEIDGDKRNQISILARALGSHLATNDPSVWALVNKNIKDSEYPIVNWLKNNRAHSNFMLTLIQTQYKEPLTKNQTAFIQKFKDSSVFLFPNSIYMAWLAHSYDADSSFNPMYRESLTTNFYHSNLTDNLLLRTVPKEVTLATGHYYKKEKAPVDTTFRYPMGSDKLVRIQGRTILFSDPSGEVFAVKVQKKGEPKSSLEEEFRMADYLRKNQSRLDVHSELPEPLGQYSVKKSEILELCSGARDYEQLVALIADTKDLEVYVYKAPPTYFTYLHDEHQSFKQFTSSVKKNVHDLFALLREGIVFPQLADIFHTHSSAEERDDKGRYQALVQLLNVLQFQLGRVDKWQKAVEFVNLRSSGLADLGDSMPITSLLTASDFTKRYFSELLTGGYHPSFMDKSGDTASSLFTSKRELFGNYLYLNTIAEYLLVVQLTLGSYGNKVTSEISDNSQKANVWKELAALMFSSCAEAISLMTGMPESKALGLLKQRVSLDKHFKQTQFWMTPDYSALDESALRSEQYSLYSGEPIYEVNDALVSGVGMAVDGVHQDLGGYNRESPLRELEKLLYATVTLIEGTMQLDKEFFKQLTQTEELIESDADADSCFKAAAKLLDMARPNCHVQLKLALSYFQEITLKYPSAPTDSYHARFQSVTQHEAAIKIQRFWRSTHKNLTDTTEVEPDKSSKPTM